MNYIQWQQPIVNKRKRILKSVGTKEIKTSSNYSTLQNYTPTSYECKLSISYIRISCSHHSWIPVYKKRQNAHRILARFFMLEGPLRSPNSTILEGKKLSTEWFNTRKVLLLLLNEGQEPPNSQSNCSVHYTGGTLHISRGTPKIRITNYICQYLKKKSHRSLNSSPQPNFYEEIEAQRANIFCPNFNIIFNSIKISPQKFKNIFIYKENSSE